MDSKEKLTKLLNLLSFKLKHKDYVAAFNLIYDLKLGNLSKEQNIEIFKEVAHLEHEFNNYKKFSVIQVSKMNMSDFTKVIIIDIFIIGSLWILV
mgnify:CR=1 FL=1